MHQAVRDRIARGLHQEDISAANVLQYLYVDLAVRKLHQLRLPKWQTEEVTDFLCERRIRGTAEDLELVILPRANRFLFALRIGSLILHICCCRSAHGVPRLARALGRGAWSYRQCLYCACLCR